MERFRKYFKRFYDIMDYHFRMVELEENVLADADKLIQENNDLQEQLDKAENRLLLFLKFAKQADLDYEDDIVFEDFDKWLENNQLEPKETE